MLLSTDLIIMVCGYLGNLAKSHKAKENDAIKIDCHFQFDAVSNTSFFRPPY
jgi:hypothetical protein